MTDFAELVGRLFPEFKGQAGLLLELLAPVIDRELRKRCDALRDEHKRFVALYGSISQLRQQYAQELRQKRLPEIRRAVAWLTSWEANSDLGLAGPAAQRLLSEAGSALDNALWCSNVSEALQELKQQYEPRFHEMAMKGRTEIDVWRMTEDKTPAAVASIGEAAEKIAPLHPGFDRGWPENRR